MGAFYNGLWYTVFWVWWYIIIHYGIYLKGSGGDALEPIQIMLEKAAYVVYNMLNRTAGRWMHLTRSGE